MYARFLGGVPELAGYVGKLCMIERDGPFNRVQFGDGQSMPFIPRDELESISLPEIATRAARGDDDACSVVENLWRHPARSTFEPTGEASGPWFQFAPMHTESERGRLYNGRKCRRVYNVDEDREGRSVYEFENTERVRLWPEEIGVEIRTGVGVA